MYYWHMMNGGWGFEVLSMFFWLFIFFVIAIVVVRLLRGSHHLGVMGRADPLDIAKERYARGDITKEQFDQLKKDLK